MLLAEITGIDVGILRGGDLSDLSVARTDNVLGGKTGERRTLRIAS